MYASGNLVGGSAAVPTRRFAIGTTILKDSVVVVDPVASNIGDISTPASVNDYLGMVGVALEGGTASTTQGQGSSSAEVLVETTFGPFLKYRGNVSAAVTAATALLEETDGVLLTNTSASAGGIVVTDADVGTSDYIGGWMYARSGNNKGERRKIASHSDNTSETVTVPFDYALAVGDTFLRTFAFGNIGLELTTNHKEFNGKMGAGVDLPDTGHAIVWEVYVDLDRPAYEVEWTPRDSAWNKLA